MQLGSMFISNCNITVYVSDAFCVHPQEHLTYDIRKLKHKTLYISNTDYLYTAASRARL